MKASEKAEESLKREINEETSLKSKKLKFLFYQDEIIPKLKINNIVLVFSVKVSGKEKFNFEVIDSGFFSKKEIEKLNIAFTHKDIIRRFFKHKKS